MSVEEDKSHVEEYETIAIDSDSDNSSDCVSIHELNLDEDSNAKSSTTDKNLDELAILELKKISLDATGKFMADFDPEKSKRELRKMNRRLNSKGSKHLRLYDEKGILLESKKDLCDCLDKDCPGCFFPCPRCCSYKCGNNCRCNRKYIIDSVTIEGTGRTIPCPEGYN